MFKFIQNKKVIIIVISIVLLFLVLLTIYILNKDENKSDSFFKEITNIIKNDEKDSEDNPEKKEKKTTEENTKKETSGKDEEQKETTKEEEETNSTEDNKRESSKEEKATTNSGNNTNNNNSSNPVINYTAENARLAQEIINLYRVSVLYDSKAYYTYNGVSSTKTSEADAVKVNNFLKSLKVYLGHFPQSIFDTLRMEVGYSIHILKQLPDNKAGYAIYQPYGSYRIVLDVDTTLIDRILYHETFHIMDRYMYWRNGGVDAFPEWNSLNPAGFVYGVQNNDYTWIDTTKNPSDIDFVSAYSKLNVLEDRAELFSDLMFRSTKKKFMNKGYGINEKAIYLDSVIDKYFGNFANARWERWISR